MSDTVQTSAQSSTALRCRPIAEGDLDAAVDLLCRGFPERGAAYWRTGLSRLRARALPEGVPRYGYLLESGPAPVGVLLTLYSVADDGSLRCNLSSWYVEPRFQGMATLLDRFAMRDRSVTYLNVSPAPHTRAMHEARGFAAYVRGQTLILPALSRGGAGRRVRPFTAEASADLSPRERAVADDHAGYGCLCLLLADASGTRLAVFQRRSKPIGRWRLPYLELVYGPAGPDLVPWLGPLGRRLLARHAIPWIFVDANGPIPGAVGRYFEGRAIRLARGQRPEAPGDLSYTELVVFGP